MSTFFTDISAALSGRLNTLTGGTPVAWENLDYTPTDGVMFLRETLLSGDTTQTSFGNDGYDEHVGVYQIDVFAPKGGGKGAAITKADAIADHFRRGTTLTYNSADVRIRTVSRAGLGYDDNWIILSITIEYFAHTAAR